MKKTICILVLFFTAFIFVNGNAFFTEFGFKTGVVSSNIKSDFFFTNRSKLGLDFGVFAESKKFKNFQLVAEVHYIQKGIIDAYIIFDPVTYEILDMTELKHRLDYISIPVLLKLSKEYDIILPYLMFGPRFDYLFSYRSDIYGVLFDEVNNFVLGGDFVLGTEMKISEEITGIFELRYNFDITLSENIFNSKNEAFQVLIGFKFSDLKKLKKLRRSNINESR